MVQYVALCGLLKTFLNVIAQNTFLMSFIAAWTAERGGDPDGMADGLDCGGEDEFEGEDGAGEGGVRAPHKPKRIKLL